MALEDIWKQFDPVQKDFVKILFNAGPYGLLSEAEKLGYKKAVSFASKCHLCTSIRQFFFGRGAKKSILGPAECYFDSGIERDDNYAGFSTESVLP